MEDTILEEEVGLLHLPPHLVPALARAVGASLGAAPLRASAESVLHGEALDRQQLDIVRLQRELERAAECHQQQQQQDQQVMTVPFFRRLQWARLLRLLTGETLEDWAQQVQQQRQEYRSLCQQQQLSASKLASLDPQRFHPLAATAGNPWSQKQADEELLEEIWRDIERTYPERQIFNADTTRRSLQRVLFAWAKNNTDVSYKQGMNELLAVLYLACAREALPSNASRGPPGADGALGAPGAPAAHQSQESPEGPFSVLLSSDPEDIEADAFRLFDALMTDCCVRSMYLPPQQDPPSPAKGNALLGALGGPQGASRGPRGPPQSAVLVRCSRVFSKLLAKADRAVYLHLDSLSVEPQVFLLRWLRLLFCREFHVEDTLLIWDAIFADAWLASEKQRQQQQQQAAPAAAAAKSTELSRLPAEQQASLASSKLPLVDFFAVGMLKFIRQHLLQSDVSGCLRRLLKFPDRKSVV